MARLDDDRLPDYPNVYISGARSAYAPEDVRDTMTVGELIDFLEQFDEESLVFLENDNGYTFGGLESDSIFSPEIEDDDFLDNLRYAIGEDDDDEEDLDFEESSDSNHCKKDHLTEKSGEIYRVWLRETENDPIAVESMEVNNIFDAIRILMGYKDEFHVKDAISHYCDYNSMDEIEEIDAIDFFMYLLDNQEDTWDAIYKVEGPDFTWENNFEEEDEDNEWYPWNNPDSEYYEGEKEDPETIKKWYPWEDPESEYYEGNSDEEEDDFRESKKNFPNRVLSRFNSKKNN